MSTTSQKDNIEYYKPVNILITGGAGFIGRAVANYLVNKYNYNIIVVDILDYCSAVKHLDKRVLFIRGDVCNMSQMNDIVKKYSIDTIMHFAAQTHVDNSFNNSIEFTKTNVLGTHILAQVAVDNKVKRFIHVSTDEVYCEQSINDIAGCVEKATLNPTNPYAATKCGAEFIIKSYQKSYNLPAIITRSNNVYGGGQYPEKLIPCFIMKLIHSIETIPLHIYPSLPIHGSGKSLRNFIYIDDEVDCFDKILHYGKINNIYNISGNSEYSVNEIADILAKKFKTQHNNTHVADRNFNDQRYFIDSTNLKMLYYSIGEKLNLTPFDEGIDKTIEWYKRYGDSTWPAKDKEETEDPENCSLFKLDLNE